MSSLALDAEALYVDLLAGVRALLQDDALLVGVWSGGAWLAERLQRDLNRPGAHGVISSTLHRDDYRSRGLAAGAEATRLPVAIDGRAIVLVDDVLFTGRTIAASLDALKDVGRPRIVQLAVLIDRGHRQLPIQADHVGKQVQVPPDARVNVRLAEIDEADTVTISLTEV